MTAKKRKKGALSKSAGTKSAYEPTEQELAAIVTYQGRVRHPRVKICNDGVLPKIKSEHPDEVIGIAMLGEALGTGDLDFLYGLLNQLGNAGSKGGELDENGINFMLSVIAGIKPRDQIEAMLAAQMAAVHSATMTFAGRLAHVENIRQQDSAERAFNKLVRTFASQVEALKRYRSSGEQKVTVQYVNVSDG